MTNKEQRLKQIARDALNELSRLMGEEMDPIDKFNACMSRYYASDDIQFIIDGYDVALEIDDDAEKAKALMLILDEIHLSKIPNVPVNETDGEKNKKNKKS